VLHATSPRFAAAGWIVVVLCVTVLAVGAASTTADGIPGERSVDIVARRYAFDPAVIRAERGDRLRLRFASLDVVHGFHLEGYDIDVTVEPLRREVHVRRGAGPLESVSEVTFVADRPGKFRFRCSKTCGAMHPFMTGELIVGPNRLLHGSSAAALGLLVGGLAWAWSLAGREESS
jgi:heme/copper-type cytochrome/quinol oxidase subunit 2